MRGQKPGLKALPHNRWPSRNEADETEEGFLASYAGQLSFEIGLHAKPRCTTFSRAPRGIVCFIPEGT
jgi:hypothetical protein